MDREQHIIVRNSACGICKCHLQPVLFQSHGFLFSVNVPGTHVKQRSASESRALDFAYLHPCLITFAIIQHENRLNFYFWMEPYGNAVVHNDDDRTDINVCMNVILYSFIVASSKLND